MRWTTLDSTIRFPKHVWVLWKVCGMKQVSKQLFDAVTNSLCMIIYTSMSSNPFGSEAPVCNQRRFLLTCGFDLYTHSCFENRDRFFSEDYLPTNEDVLHARLRTSGMNDIHLDFPQASQYRVIDVEGERSGRKKWVHAFEEVHCLIFVVPLSAYNSCMVEDAAGVRAMSSTAFQS